MPIRCRTVLTAVLVLLVAPISGRAQVVVSANDGKMSLVDGKLVVRSDRVPDSVTILRVHRGIAAVVADVEVPTSVLGPPFSIAITPDERLALVTAPLYVDPQRPDDTSPDDSVSILDLAAQPPRVIGSVSAGKGAAGLSISPDGRLALVANRREGSVSVLEISGSSIRKIDTVKIGDVASGLGHVAITPDGKTALVSRDGDNTLSVLAIDGLRVSDTKRDFGIGLKPYGIAMAPDGGIAIVANVSLGRGDEDTLGVVDLRSSPIRVVNTVSVGQTPEGIAISPDGKWCAVAALNGSNKPKDSPFFSAKGKVVLFRVTGTSLTRVSEREIGGWPQGAVFSADSRSLLVGSMAERSVQVFRVGRDGSLSRSARTVPLKSGNAALRAAEPRPH
jgi:DNA-binding beta-propeller fold protein YncE